MTDPDALQPLTDAQRFMRLLWKLNHAIETCSKQMSVRLGVTFQQRTVLRLVGQYPGITAGKLADMLHVDPGTLSAALGRLEGRGLVERRQDPKDRRRVRLGLTADGRALDTPAVGTVENALEETFTRIKSEQLWAAESVIDALIVQLERQTSQMAGQATEDDVLPP